MTNNPIFQSSELFDDLRERLAACPMVNQYGVDEAGTLVHAFTDLEESMRTFLNEQLPKLTDPAFKGEQLEELLMDIREEFRHIAYHIHDPEFFRLVEPTHEWLALAESVKKAGSPIM